jgi:hypothetical protein
MLDAHRGPGRRQVAVRALAPAVLGLVAAALGWAVARAA